MKKFKKHNISIIVSMFYTDDYVEAFGRILATVDYWSEDDWIKVMTHIPVSERLVQRHIRFYYIIRKKMGRLKSKNETLYDKYKLIDKTIDHLTKWAKEQYAMKCLTLAC